MYIEQGVDLKGPTANTVHKPAHIMYITRLYFRKLRNVTSSEENGFLSLQHNYDMWKKNR